MVCFGVLPLQLSMTTIKTGKYSAKTQTQLMGITVKWYGFVVQSEK